MREIELFGREIPLIPLLAAIVLAAIGTGIMASGFEKGPQTFYAFGHASIVEFPNRAKINDNISVSPVNSTPATESFPHIFTIYHKNNKLVLVDVSLANRDMLGKFFDDIVVIIRKQNDDNLLATLTLSEFTDSFTDKDPNAQSGVMYEADILYTAKNDVSPGNIPVIITAELTSQ